LAWQVKDFQVDWGVQRLDRDAQVLLLHSYCRFFVALSLFPENAFDNGSFSYSFASNDNHFERSVVAHFCRLANKLFALILIIDYLFR